jgi:hypothetical protein
VPGMHDMVTVCASYQDGFLPCLRNGLLAVGPPNGRQALEWQKTDARLVNRMLLTM